jgi:hypothetical protein
MEQQNGEPCKSPDDQYAEACEAADLKRDEMQTREPETDHGDFE